MNKFSFPVVEVSGYKLISNKGDVSYFYEINGVDLEQMSLIEKDNFFNHLKSKLNTLEGGAWLKLYRIDKSVYLNTSIEGYCLGLDSKPCNNPLEVFFENSDIYSDIGLYSDYLLFNGRYRRIVSVRSFSDTQIDEYFIPESVDYCISFKKKSKEKALRELEQVRNAHSACLSKSKRDFESEGAYSQAEDLISELISGNESLFEMELYFLPKANSLESLNLLTFDLIEELNIKGIKSFIEGHSLKELKTGLFEIYKEIIVGVKPSFSFRSIPNKTSHLAYLLPIAKSKLMDEGLFLKDISNNDLFFNPFSNEFKNRNMLVTGTTGSGKSVLVNKIVHGLVDKHPTVILDKGGSFRRLCLYHGGYNLSRGINPMQFKCPYFLREFILSVVDKDKFTKLEKGLLLKRIKSYLQDEIDLSHHGMIEYLENDFDGLSLYFEDIKDFLISDNIGINDFLYVDIENYPNSQIAPLIIYILEYFKRIADSRKILVFDECWKFLKNHGEYIDECFRTFRKTGAFPIAISQGLSDFENLGEDLYSSITNNSYFKIFFPQEYIESNDITDFDNSRIASLQYEKGKYSECYLKSTDNKIKKILRITLDPLEYELFHTESGQSENFYKFYEDHRKYFSSNKETIKSFVRLHHG